MLQATSRFFVNLMQKYLPAPFLFAIILTFVVFLMGWSMTDAGFIDMTRYWGEGFWDLLEFAMQMSLILVTGHILANSRPIKSILRAGASVPKNMPQAIVMVTIVGAIASWIQWGFGLVVLALFSKEVARVVKGVDYRLLIASAYSGYLVWHAGLAGSVTLAIAGEGHDFADIMGVIPTSQTIFNPANLLTVLALIILLPILNRAMIPKEEDIIEVDPAVLEDEVDDTENAKLETVSDYINNSRAISMIIGGLGMIYVVYYFANQGFDLNLNIVNFIFLFLGILLHGTPQRFLNALPNASVAAGPIIVQFPFYAGIMGMMTASGLAAIMSESIIGFANETTFPIFTFLSAGILNFFVPSGGGQWAVQAPIVMPAAEALNVDYAQAAMAVAWGDAWTNMIQPFWALPALAIAGLGAKDIMGYCIMALILSGIVIPIGLMFM
ncbi:short-chain fatty acid transporter [Natranaerofaba carboxydovora]|uniref:short-chain fatty acid transporter n=1 Tax=Natranaerofaba carboxydovora TaxID=2742683 RepID=UPI001F144EC9|nr:short-chain fatty acid transporter [Natranaerofaba carboxydovora]UMZ73633.1 Putative short-chain fatty acid transporter [Natranaerofaba carboxydovora]